MPHATSFSDDELEYIINHVLLPPRLPHEDDAEDWKKQDALLRLVHERAQAFVHQCSPSQQTAWQPALRMLARSISINQQGVISEPALSGALRDMAPHDAIMLTIKAQNAGLIFTKVPEASVVVDAFEIAATTEAVVGTTGRLIRTFPGSSVRFSSDLLRDPLFLAQVTARLCQLAVEVVASTMPTTRKAGETLVEERDTAAPFLVTECLMNVFAALGGACESEAIQKHTRDDVVYHHSKLPWRRSPSWLVLRVALQMTLSRAFPHDPCHAQYKSFMLFLLSDLCSMATLAHLPVDTQKLLAAKVAGRVWKLGSLAEKFVLEASLAATQATRCALESAWVEVRGAEMTRLPTLQTTVVDKDMAIVLSRGRDRLVQAMLPPATSPTQSSFRPQHLVRSGKDDLELPQLTQERGPDRFLALADVELWVSGNLAGWLDGRLQFGTDVDESCRCLAALLRAYITTALEDYQNNPRERSMMLLVTLEMWVALDKLCLRSLPLLAEFSPIIPPTLLQPLLLPRKDHLARLAAVEQHLLHRQRDVAGPSSSLLTEDGHSSFAFKLYDSSLPHQRLRMEVVTEATRKRAAKKTEWESKSSQYRSLVESAQFLEHDYEIDEDGISQHRNCTRCTKEKEARNISISYDEWPLPENEASIRRVILELSVPLPVLVWRESTWMILQDLGRARVVSAESVEDILFGYSLLRQHQKIDPPRITLASRTKSFLRAHYQRKRFPVTLQAVCVKNALQLHLFDSSRSAWIARQDEKPSLRHLCTLNIPFGPYLQLGYAARACAHSTSQVIAEQSECSPKLTVLEYLAFGSLRAGERLQWRNILRELGLFNLSFNEEAVMSLILQAIWQAGSPAPDTIYRTAHEVFKESAFSTRLLEMLWRRLSMVEANWREQNAMFILVAIALRALSLAPTSDIAAKVIAFLRSARVILGQWSRDLTAIQHGCTDEDDSKRNMDMLSYAACICRMTYDVDSQHVRSLLADAADVATFIECSVLVHDNTAGRQDELPPYLRQAVERNQKISHASEDWLRHLILQDQTGINCAMASIWQDVTMRDQWQVLPSPNERWVINTTADSPLRRPQSVCYNLLSGSLLVDGNPLGRLPSQYVEDPIYRRVFGSRILHVFASDMPGMSYMTARDIHGHQLHLGVWGQQLRIKARRGSQVLELIPLEFFQDDLPEHFAVNFVHWINVETGEIEFRPLSTLWHTSPENWRLHFSPTASSRMTRGQDQMIDHRSNVASQIMTILNAIEDRTHMHITWKTGEGIEAELPRFNLRFFVDQTGHLRSRELAAVVDQDQSIGTLCGLCSRLVLRDVTFHEHLSERSVLVPHGVVHVTKRGEHVRVRVNPGDSSQIRYFRYKLDLHLQKLRGPPGRLGELYKAYLHAVTSYVLADPFTGRTGTEEALISLRNESLRLSTPLETAETRVLHAIAALSPKRTFYPVRLRRMEVVFWDANLSELAQHEEFSLAAREIETHAARFAALYDGNAPEQSSGSGTHEHLVKRARLRNASFRSYESGGNAKQDRLDATYQARDRGQTSGRARRAFEIASLIREWPSTIHVTHALDTRLCRWGTIAGYGQTFTQSILTEILELSMPNAWGALYNLCRFSTRESDTYQLMFLFGFVAFGDAGSLPDIHVLLAFAFGRFEDLDPPPYPAYALEAGAHPVRRQLSRTIRNACVPFERRRHENHDQRQRRRSAFERDQAAQVESFCQNALDKWPCEALNLPDRSEFPLIKVKTAHRQVEDLLASWFHNKLFLEHINRVQERLEQMTIANIVTFWPEVPLVDYIPELPSPRSPLVNLSGLLSSKSPPPLEKFISALVAPRQQGVVSDANRYSELRDMILTLRSSHCPLRQEYGKDLQESLQALEAVPKVENPVGFPFDMTTLLTHRLDIETQLEKMMSRLKLNLGPTSQIDKVIESADIWPRLTPQSLLAMLSATNSDQISKQWREYLVVLGEVITLLQRVNRLIRLQGLGNVVGSYRESENGGREGWSAVDYPEWLLMEIENDFMIRRVQATVALAMIRPEDARNSVLQLNMGEGKSSVIIPMVAVALADRRRLVRVIVLKPLLRQTEYLLSQRLGGLVNRRVYHTPFSRQTPLDPSLVAHLQEIFEECKGNGGVLLALPEHILSFRLMGRERLSYDRTLATHLMETEKWLQKHARDVLDESDEILATHFQLVYTTGLQQPMDGQPDRWTVCQKMLSLVRKHAGDVQAQDPGDLEVGGREHAFPTLRFCSDRAGRELVSRLVRDLTHGAGSGISYGHCPSQVQEAVVRFICRRSLEADDADQVMQFFGNTNYQHIILLLRGLIAHGILLFVLQKKRWLVDYGLDPKRSLMAVPYRAKGVPSLNSEFGHPDVALLLTCLSYYYTGLTFDQLGQCFDLLFKETDPSDEYDRWYAGSPSLSEKLRGLHAINLEDSHLRTQDLFPHLQFNMVVIDFYLNKVVFPREGKEFPTKLSASGWDIPAHESEQITTGFSGTNDNRFLLPLSIRQADLPELRHTNAMVLNLLLQPENRLYLYARDQEGQRLSVEGLLRLIARQEPSIQVLLDVGAQVLEMKNREVAEAWLRCVPTAEAAVFFDEGDEVMVLSRRGLYERLVVSPFHHRLENCLIYLDEVHTRGVDLDIPAGVRAAVTLGPRLIKDRLVQACLRMRKMGCGHSLAFFGPPEVHQSIRAFVEKDSTAQLDAADVVRWSLEQTCKLTKDNKSLWVMQGFEHDQRTRACRALAAGSASLESVMSDDGRVQAFGERIQVAESHTLEEMYGPRSGPCAPSSNATESDADDEGDGDVLTELHRVWHTLDPTSVRDGVMHEEQEREVAHEIERERQVQRPGKLGFRASHLHPTVKHFVQYGTFPPGNIQDAVRSAARSLDHTMVTRLLADADMWPQLWATVDFAQTVDAKGGHTDEYLRPVNWILTSSASHAAVIISPYEANELIPTIKRSNRVRLHMYAARTTGTMVSFADLSFYTLTGDTPPYEAPPAMIRNLHLFGGSLYLDDWTQYCAVCHHLGILMKRDTIDDGVRVSSDGFVDEAGRALLRWPVSSPFKTSPLPFLKALLGLRMKGGSFPQTHLGSLVEGRTLGAESFEERQDR